MSEVRTRPGETADADTGPADDAARAEAERGAAPERVRAAAYLDLWERHVGDAAAHGKGISALWFSR
ncbi:MAG: hypothetical protein ABTQ27_00500 [Amaricoccus sp.]|uniref:hypothetical protein n=1 Tax=Amaricoccus sp. TaxID=1872485 RepID=UPI0033162E01